MRAIVHTRYGPPDLLELTDVAQPVPGDGQVLVRVHAASVNPLDWHTVRGEPYFLRIGNGLRRPNRRELGVDLAGQVTAVGPNVVQLQPGDDVFGCAYGAFSEYACGEADKLAVKPTQLSFEQAAALPVAALTALQGLRDKGGIRAGHRVLIIGASGGVGTFAVQIAKAFGAEVTGVCSTEKLDLVRSLGADHVVDYSREDFVASGHRYDLILDSIGNRSLAECRRAMTRQGSLVVIGAPGGRWLAGLSRFGAALLLSPFVSQRLRPFVARITQEDLVAIRELVEAGRVAPVLDRTYALGDTPEALRYLEAGHARGKVVIRVAEA